MVLVEPAHVLLGPDRACREAAFLPAPLGPLAVDEARARAQRAVGSDELEGDNQAFRAIGDAVSAPAYIDAVNWLHEWSRRAQSWWLQDGYDLLVTPTLAVPPPEIGYLSDPELGGQRVVEVLQYTAQFNITGQPAVSLPLTWTAGGLPVGVQFVAPYGREDLLLRVASQLEEARPWADRMPAVHA